ncbi:hypothetical protein [Mobiluncus sp.]|uniref:hypothetical protein n=1 Tax=Mobiluncus sp. TaxID=47293 RepID=UPI002A9146D3|nr:hypothetical protein [Mobiluncus sp.]MDY6076864.1 hypothetical protein [Mobiluncus sp.]
MSTENFTPAGPGAPQPEVKKTLAFVALALCIVASIIMIAGHIITGQQVAATTGGDISQLGLDELSSAMDAATKAGDQLLIYVGIAGLLNFVAFILSLIALIKSHPKTLPLIIFIVVIVLPAIALAIGRAAQASILPTV